MAYTPTLQDFDDAVGQSNAQTPYTPTLQDFDDAVNEQQPQHGFLMNTLLGAGGGVRDLLQDIADIPPNLAPSIFPRGQFPQVSHGDPGSWGRMIGGGAANVGAFMAGGEGLEGARALSEGLPYVGRLASALAPDVGSSLLAKQGINAARQGIGTGIYGAVTNPNDPTGGAITGTLAGAAGGFLPIIPPGLKQMSDFLNVDKAKAAFDATSQTSIDNLVNSLRPGKNAQTSQGIVEQPISDTTQSLATSLRNLYQAKNDQSKTGFKNVFNLVGDKPMYMSPEPVKGYQTTKDAFGATIQTPFQQELPTQIANSNNPSSFSPLLDQLKNNIDPSAESLLNKFAKNPTFENAHYLQSQIGSDIGQWNKISRVRGLEPAQYNNLKNLIAARSSLQNDMDSYLQANNPDVAPLYQKEIQNWQQNILPFRSDRQLLQIAKSNPDKPGANDILNPSVNQLLNIFRDPEPGTMNLANQLGDSFKDQLMSLRLGKKNNLDMNKVFDIHQSLDKEGLADYVTPNFDNQVSQLKQMAANHEINLKNKESIKGLIEMLTGGGLGFVGGHYLSAPFEAAVGLGGVGALLAKSLWPKIDTSPTMQSIGKGISATGRYGYNPTKNLILANTLPGASN